MGKQSSSARSPPSSHSANPSQVSPLGGNLIDVSTSDGVAAFQAAEALYTQLSTDEGLALLDSLDAPAMLDDAGMGVDGTVDDDVGAGVTARGPVLMHSVSTDVGAMGGRNLASPAAGGGDSTPTSPGVASATSPAPAASALLRAQASSSSGSTAPSMVSVPSTSGVSLVHGQAAVAPDADAVAMSSPSAVRISGSSPVHVGASAAHVGATATSTTGEPLIGVSLSPQTASTGASSRTHHSTNSTSQGEAAGGGAGGGAHPASSVATGGSMQGDVTAGGGGGGVVVGLDGTASTARSGHSGFTAGSGGAGAASGAGLLRVPSAHSADGGVGLASSPPPPAHPGLAKATSVGSNSKARQLVFHDPRTEEQVTTSTANPGAVIATRPGSASNRRPSNSFRIPPGGDATGAGMSSGVPAGPPTPTGAGVASGTLTTASSSSSLLPRRSLNLGVGVVSPVRQVSSSSTSASLLSPASSTGSAGGHSAGAHSGGGDRDSGDVTSPAHTAGGIGMAVRSTRASVHAITATDGAAATPLSLHSGPAPSTGRGLPPPSARAVWAAPTPHQAAPTGSGVVAGAAAGAQARDGLVSQSSLSGGAFPLSASGDMAGWPSMGTEVSPAAHSHLGGDCLVYVQAALPSTTSELEGFLELYARTAINRRTAVFVNPVAYTAPMSGTGVSVATAPPPAPAPAAGASSAFSPQGGARPASATGRPGSASRNVVTLPPLNPPLSTAPSATSTITVAPTASQPGDGDAVTAAPRVRRLSGGAGAGMTAPPSTTAPVAHPPGSIPGPLPPVVIPPTIGGSQGAPVKATAAAMAMTRPPPQAATASMQSAESAHNLMAALSPTSGAHAAALPPSPTAVHGPPHAPLPFAVSSRVSAPASVEEPFHSHGSVSGQRGGSRSSPASRTHAPAAGVTAGGTALLVVPIPAEKQDGASPVGVIAVWLHGDAPRRALAPSTIRHGAGVAVGDGFTAVDRAACDMVAVTMAQVNRRLKQMNRALSANKQAYGLVEIVKAVSHEIGVTAILTRIISVAYEQLSAERVSVSIVDYDTQELVMFVSEDAAGLRMSWDKGISGAVVRTGKGINIADAYKSDLFDRSYDVKTGYRTRSVLCMPIKHPDGTVVAVITAINKREGKESFTLDDTRMLSVVADTAGVTLHKAKLLEEAEMARASSAALADVVRLVNEGGHDDIESLTSRLVEIAYRLIDADRITLFLVDELKRELFCQVSQDAGDLRMLRIPLGHGIAGSVAESGVTENIADCYEDARFNRAYDQSTGYRTRSMLCMPVKLAGGGRTVAVIQAINKHSGGPFTRNDEELLEAFSTEVGAVIDRKSVQLAYDKVIADEETAPGGGGMMASLLTQYVRAEEPTVGGGSLPGGFGGSRVLRAGPAAARKGSAGDTSILASPRGGSGPFPSTDRRSSSGSVHTGGSPQPGATRPLSPSSAALVGGAGSGDGAATPVLLHPPQGSVTSGRRGSLSGRTGTGRSGDGPPLVLLPTEMVGDVLPPTSSPVPPPASGDVTTVPSPPSSALLRPIAPAGADGAIAPPPASSTPVPSSRPPSPPSTTGLPHHASPAALTRLLAAGPSGITATMIGSPRREGPARVFSSRLTDATAPPATSRRGSKDTPRQLVAGSSSGTFMPSGLHSLAPSPSLLSAREVMTSRMAGE